MGRKAVERDEMGDALVEVLLELLEKSGASRRELSRVSGVKWGRVSAIFGAGAPIYIDEVDAMATSLGTRGSLVFAEAERRLGRGGVGLSPAPVASDEQQDLSDLDVILAASDRNIDAEVEAWQQEP